MYSLCNGVIRSHQSKKNRLDTMAIREWTKRQTLIYKTLCRKLKIKQHENTINRDGSANSAPLVGPVVLLLSKT